MFAGDRPGGTVIQFPAGGRRGMAAASAERKAALPMRGAAPAKGPAMDYDSWYHAEAIAPAPRTPSIRPVGN